MKYQIEITEKGYKMSILFSEGGMAEGQGIRGMSLETEGGHDALEEFYDKAEETWGFLRQEYEQQAFDRIRETP